MRLKGLKRREEQKLIVSMGGFRATVAMKHVALGPFGDWGRAYQAVLSFDGTAIPERNNLRSNGLHDTGQSVWFDHKHSGTFTEQAPELINQVSSILGLFPVMLTDFRTQTTFLVNGNWLTPLDILNQEMKLNDQVVKRFRAKAEIPLALSETNVVTLACEGELVIKNNTVLFEGHGKIFEKETGLETSADELFIAEAELDFDQQIRRKMSETIESLPLKVITHPHPNTSLKDKDGNPLVCYGSFAATGPIHGKDVIRWILRAALDCGVVFSLADLAEYEIAPPVFRQPA